MKILLILFIAFMALLSYSLCVASSTADKDAHEAYERWKERKKNERSDVSKTQIDSAPSIDIVRCQDCKYWVYNFNGCSRNPCTEPWYATDYCSYGEREGE